MNDLQRERFEKWCENDAPHLFVNYLPSLGCYSNGDTQTAWEAWCAAIESVVDIQCTCDKINPSASSDAPAD